MKKSMELKSFGSIRKYKAYGACGVVLGAAALALVNGGAVSADEVSTTTPQPKTEEVAKEPASGQVVTESKVTNDTPTGNPATNLNQAAGTVTEVAKAEQGQAGKVTGESNVSVDHTEVNEAAKDAQQSGVNVVQDKTSVAPTTSTAAETDKAVKSISADEANKAKELKSVAAEHSTAMSTWNKQKDSVVAHNNELDKAHLSAVEKYNDFIKGLDADTAAVVAQYKDAIIEVTEQVQKSSDGNFIEGYQAYIKELAAQQGLNKQAIKDYLIKKADYESKSTVASETVKRNLSNSVRIENENKAKSQSVDAENNKRSQSAANENKRLSESAAAVIKDNTAKSNSVKAENDRRSTSAANENKRLSESAAAVIKDNKAKSQSVVAENNRRSQSVDAENKRLSESAAAVIKDNLAKSNSVKAENDRRSQSADAENKRLSLSAAKVINDNKAQSEAVKKQNEEANKYNKSLMESRGLTWTGDWEKDSATVAAYNADEAKRTIKHESYDEVGAKEFEDVNNRNHDRGTGLPAAANGYTPSGSSTMLKKTTLPNGVEVVATGSLTKTGSKVLFKGKNLDLSKVVTSVKWGNVDASGANLRTLRPGDLNDEWGRVYNYRRGGATKFYVGKVNTWYRIPNAATTADGKVHDVYALFHTDPRGLHPYYQRAGEVAFWNADGAINAVDGARTTIGNDGDGIRTVLSLDRPDNHDKDVIWSTLVTDIDGGQYVEEGGTLLGVGGGMTTNTVVTNKPKSDSNLGYTYGINKDENALNGSQSAPDGTILVVQSGMYSSVIRNTPGTRASLVARTDFGADSEIQRTFITKKVTKKVLPPISLKTLDKYKPGNSDYTPVSYTPVTFTPRDASYKPVDYTPVTFTPKDATWKPVDYEVVPFNPKDSSYKPVDYERVNYIPTPYNPEKVPELPKEPVLKLTKLTAPADPNFHKIPNEPVKPTVHYHLTSVNENTPVEKKVQNEDGVDINNQSVAKNSTNHFILTPKSLPAGRPITTELVNSDYIVKGLELDIAGMQKANPTWDISYTKETRLLKVKAKEVELDKANADRTKAYTPTAFTVIFRTLNDSATYENVFRMDVNGGSKGENPNGYTSYSNKVKIHTPGGKDNPNDPTNPNGGGNHKIQPVKNNTNVDGKNINNKTLLQSDINYYVAEWDLDQYNNDKSSKSAIAKGFGYIDNYDEKAVEPLKDKYNIVDAKGNKVEGLKMYEADSSKIDELPESVQQFLKDSGIDYSKFGKFHVWVAEDSQSFYNKYVKTGTDIFFNLPMAVKKGYTGKYTNQTYQIDFGNGYYGNIVRNNVPNLTPKKDVIVDGKSNDGGTVMYGQEFKYLLSGAKLPGNRGSHLWEYKYLDDYDQKGDKYLGTYKVVASTDFKVVDITTVEKDTVATEDTTLEDGTVIKAGKTIKAGSKVKTVRLIKKGTDLTEYTTQEHDEANGIVTIAFKEKFLKSISDDSEFGADATIDMKRIAYGEFENKYVNRVNGVDYISNTVRTKTPKPEEPAKPQEPAKPVKPVKPTQPQLPQTGETASMGATALGVVLAVLSLGMVGRKRKED